MTATCIHAFCTRDHTMEPEPDLHEGRFAEVEGVPHPKGDTPLVATQISYRDGDRTPTLYVGAIHVELTPDAVLELIENLRGQLATMLAVQAEPLQVTR